MEKGNKEIILNNKEIKRDKDQNITININDNCESYFVALKIDDFLLSKENNKGAK